MRTNKQHNELLDALAIVVDEALDTENPRYVIHGLITLDEHDDLLGFLSGLRTDVCDECGDDLPYDEETDQYLPCPDCGEDNDEPVRENTNEHSPTGEKRVDDAMMDIMLKDSPPAIGKTIFKEK